MQWLGCIEESNRCIIYREIIFYFTMFHSMIDFLLIGHFVGQEETVSTGSGHRK